ncbi:PAZ domain containing protein [Brugia malayi]|uniref:PAZ domain containing protein n=1 Tax=Brugia malayi TaxID=6279 RepID=A0A4E9FKW2_BRUMA|nr:PAZ domain containing protein [Brugia malayi]VIO97196.1 PAZ domain containing protein [Brugia malayi]
MAGSSAVEKVRMQMEQASVSRLPVRLADKIAPGIRKSELLDVVTNVWGLISHENIPIYRYDFRVLEEYPPKKDSKEPSFKEVTKQVRNDYVAVDRRAKCFAVYQALLRREKQFFGAADTLIYDRASILYSLRKLSFPRASGDEVRKTFFLNKNELPANIVSDDCVKVHVNIKPCKEDFQLAMHDLKNCVSNNPDEINSSLQQFLEILAMQEVFFMQGRFVSYGTGECYLMDPSQFGFGDRDMPELQEGKYVAIGAAKGVRIIEGLGNFKRGINAGLVLDAKKAAFHIDNQHLLEKVESIFRRTRAEIGHGIDQQSILILSKALKGLYVRCSYGKNREFAIAGISKENAHTSKLALKTGEMSVEKYFMTKYSIKLKYPKLPLIMERCQPKNNLYPIEVLVVCENQRVSKGQQTSSQVQTMIRACATEPSVRLMQTNRLSQAMKLDNSNQHKWIGKCNMTITDNFMFPARVLPQPVIEYHTNGWINPNEKTVWMDGKKYYLIPAVCEKWYAVALMGPREERFHENQFCTYIKMFLERCRKHGMQIRDPIGYEYIRRSKEQDIESLIIKAKKSGATFIHFVTADELNYHARMKYIESQEQILTQDLKASTALGIVMKRQYQTLDNIVNKTNIKMGGLNYSVHLEENCDRWLGRPGFLIVGLDIAHPSYSRVPNKDRNTVLSVVGYSANIKKHPLDFIGGYRFAKAQMEELMDDAIQQIFSDLLRYFNANRGTPPTHLFVIRDGISVGQYKYVMNTEVEQIKHACQLVGGQNYRPHITFIVLTKMHNLRIYKKNIHKQERAAQQNIKPGTVIDKHVVNPVLSEFYLNSHSTFQGTAKTPRYTLLFDTSKMEADEMQGIVHALAYNFQIVNMAVSLPSPVMIASRMAKRGRCNYVAMFGDGSESSDNGKNNEKDAVELNKQLSYINKPLEVVRFNA